MGASTCVFDVAYAISWQPPGPDKQPAQQRIGGLIQWRSKYMQTRPARDAPAQVGTGAGCGLRASVNLSTLYSWLRSPTAGPKKPFVESEQPPAAGRVGASSAYLGEGRGGLAQRGVQPMSRADKAWGQPLASAGFLKRGG